MDTIGDRIKKLRKAKGLSLMQLANKLIVSDMTLSKIETGKTKSITIELGKKLCSALDVSFSDLFEIDRNEEADAQLRVKMDELNTRIIEKDFLVKAHSTRSKLLTYELLRAVYSGYADWFDFVNSEIDDTTDEEKKLRLTKKINDWKINLDDTLEYYVSYGLVEKGVLKEFFESWEKQFGDNPDSLTDNDHSLI